MNCSGSSRSTTVSQLGRPSGDGGGIWMSRSSRGNGIAYLGRITTHQESVIVCSAPLAPIPLRPRQITTNKGIKDWPEMLAGDEVIATAILDRLLHKSYVLNIKGRSYRLRDLEEAAAGRA